MYDTVLEKLSHSPFRSRFHLKAAERTYIAVKGMDTIERHAADFIAKRVAPAFPPNDGKQTPMRGHPVFIAQHATACCCRSCICKWHKIEPGHDLTSREQRYLVGLIMTWIQIELYR